jgi:hypothetical protein
MSKQHNEYEKEFQEKKFLKGENKDERKNLEIFEKMIEQRTEIIESSIQNEWEECHFICYCITWVFLSCVVGSF